MFAMCGRITWKVPSSKLCHYNVNSLQLEAFKYFYVGHGCGSPELYSLGPDWFEYSFVDEEFVACREF
jgi:hypothetical protein